MEALPLGSLCITSHPIIAKRAGEGGRGREKEGREGRERGERGEKGRQQIICDFVIDIRRTWKVVLHLMSSPFHFNNKIILI